MKFLILCFLSSNVFAADNPADKLQVVTTTTDLAALVRTVGGDQVEVFSIAKGTQDPHQIEAKPSFMVKLRNSNLMIAQGLELESAWMGPLIQGSRNPALTGRGVLELGPQVDPIEIPKGSISRAEGDVHPGGNPHFQLDPIRLGKAATLIADRMAELRPDQKINFTKNAENYQKQMTIKMKAWSARIQKTGIKEIVTYHKTFSYFCDRFAIKCELQVEPKPGIPPTAGHLLKLIDQIKKRNLKVVLIENLYDEDAGQKLKQDIPGLFVKRVAISVDGELGLSTNEALIENLVKVLESVK